MKKHIKLLILLTITLFINTKNVYAENTLDCTKLLKNGSKGEQVKILQKELNKVQNCNLSVDGSFGPATKSCVLAFQRKRAPTLPLTKRKSQSTKVHIKTVSLKRIECHPTPPKSLHSLWKSER